MEVLVNVPHFSSPMPPLDFIKKRKQEHSVIRMSALRGALTQCSDFLHMMTKVCGNVHQFVAICLFLQRCDNRSHKCFLFVSQQVTNEMEMCWKHAELTVVAAAVCVATSASGEEQSLEVKCFTFISVALVLPAIQ